MEEQFVVSGIVMQNEAVQSGYSINNVVAIFNECDMQPNQLLIQVTSINDYKEILDYITEKYNIDRDSCYVNFDLFIALGIITGENTLEKNDQFY